MKTLYFTTLLSWLTVSLFAATITGTVSNNAGKTGALNVALYTQANYEIYNLPSYADIVQVASPTYPYNYTLNVPQDGTYAVVVYIDTNNNNTLDLDEPADAIENVVVSGTDITDKNFIFGEAVAYSVSGQINYSGTETGNVYTYVFTQADFLAQNLTNPVGVQLSAAPTYPLDYFIAVPNIGTYVVSSFIDKNGNGVYSLDETAAYELNVVISSENVTAEVDMTFPDIDKVSVSGTISYDGTTAGKLYVVAFNQDEYAAQNYMTPLNIVEVDDPIYPYAYDIMCTDNNTCALLAFIDYNGNQQYDADEPYSDVQNIVTNGLAITGQDMALEEQVNVTAVFKLDTLLSTWDNGTENGTFHRYGNGYYTPGKINGRTALTMDSFDEDTLLFGFGFWIDETDMDELDSSYWEAGTKLHMVYTFPDSLDINFIAVGSLVDGVKVTHGRLVIDVEVVDPVHSASGDFKASCGISVSCDPKHSGGVDCYGAIFYGDLYARDMTFVVNRMADKVGMRVNGYDGVEGHFTALLPDSFLINVLQFPAGAMPVNSEVLDGFIPDLLRTQDYTVTNQFTPITTGFDMDGDGIYNAMYKLTINNSSWSAHDLVFGAAESTGVNDVEAITSAISARANLIVVNDAVDKLELFDITGKLIWSKLNLKAGDRFNLENLSVGLYIASVNGKASVKVVVL